MRLFDVLGPVMTGPSSSHTAGAVRIGSTARRLLGEQPAQAELLLYGSLAATGRGHGTDRARVAGLLGMQPDDDRIPHNRLHQPARLPSQHGGTAAGRRIRPQAGGRRSVHRRRAYQYLPD